MLLSDFKTMVTTELSDETELVFGLDFESVLSSSGMCVLYLNYNIPGYHLKFPYDQCDPPPLIYF